MNRKPMFRRTAACLAAAIVAFGLLPSASAGAAAATPSTSFSYTSAAGDPLGQGQSDTYTLSSSVRVEVTGDKYSLHLLADWQDGTPAWQVYLTAGQGDVLRPGVFLKAERVQTGRSPGIDVYGNDTACNKIYGRFTINQIGFTGDAISMLDAGFTMHCETPTAPALKGTIHLNQLPLRYRQVSEAGDPVGAGVSKTYLNSTSLLGVSGTASRIGFSISGNGDWWNGTFAAPPSRDFVVGQTYQVPLSNDGSSATLDVGGNGVGCQHTSGSFTINALTFGANGSISNFSATFVQHCDGATPALRGNLHYFA